MAVTVLVTYDVSSDGRRARVSAALQAWGDRIQRSVFICLVDADDLDELIEEVTRLIDPDSDALHVFPLCSTCGGRAVARGQGVLEEPPVFWLV